MSAKVAMSSVRRTHLDHSALERQQPEAAGLPKMGLAELEYARCATLFDKSYRMLRPAPEYRAAASGSQKVAFERSRPFVAQINLQKNEIRPLQQVMQAGTDRLQAPS